MRKTLISRGELSLGAILALIAAALSIYNGIPWATRAEVREIREDTRYDWEILRDEVKDLRSFFLKEGDKQ